MLADTYAVDMCFISTGGISADGVVYDGSGYLSVHRAMLARSQKRVLLMDHKKIDIIRERVLCDLSDVDMIITDFDFSDSVRQKFAETEFIIVETPKTQQ